jgi:hypothetical protein
LNGVALFHAQSLLFARRVRQERASHKPDVKILPDVKIFGEPDKTIGTCPPQAGESTPALDLM